MKRERLIMLFIVSVLIAPFIWLGWHYLTITRKDNAIHAEMKDELSAASWPPGSEKVDRWSLGPCEGDSGSEGPEVGLEGRTRQSYDDLFAYYESRLDEQGWRVSAVKGSGQYRVFEAFKTTDGYDLRASVQMPFPDTFFLVISTNTKEDCSSFMRPSR